MSISRVLIAMMVMVLLAGAGMTSAQSIAISEGEFTDANGKTVPAVVFENALYTMKVVPSMGARVMSWVDKDPRRPGGEYVYHGNRETGLFDDRGQLTTTAYEWQILESQGPQAAVKFTVLEPSGIRREKIIRGFAANRVVEVQYVLTNTTDAAVQESNVWIRSMPRSHAGMNSPTQSHVMLSPTRFGVHEAAWYKIKIHGDDNQYRIDDPIDNWSGYVDRQGKDGIVFWMQDGPTPTQLYYWSGPNPPYATMEPVIPRPTLTPGQSWSFTLRMMMQRGLGQYNDVSNRCLMGAEAQVDGSTVTIATTIMPVMEILDLQEKPVLQTQIRDLEGNVLESFDAVHYPRIWIQANDTTPEYVTKVLTWKAPAEGTYVARQKVLLDGKVDASCEWPFVVGEASGQYIVGGGRPEPKPIAFELSSDDAARGYIVSRLKKQGPMRHAESIRVDVGRNERESLGLSVTSFADLGEVRVSITDLKGPSKITGESVRVRYRQVLPKDPKNPGGYELRDVPSVIAGQENPVEAWLTFTVGDDIPAGTYRGKIVVEPARSEAVTLPIVVEVWPASMPKVRSTRMYAWWEMYLIWRETRPRSAQEAAEIFRPYARDLAEAGVRTLNFDPRYGTLWKTTNAQGEPDYSPMDPIIQVALEHGFDSAWMYLANAPEGFVEYLRSRGLKTIIDPSWDEAPLEISAERMARINHAVANDPLHLVRHGALSPISVDLLSTLNEYLDVWSFGGFRMAWQVKLWNEQGLIALKDGDSFGFYGGGTYTYRTDYTSLAANGWGAGILDCSHWSFYCYLRGRPAGMPWRSVFVTREGPISSPGWEGVKDGNDCFEYLKMVHAAIAQRKAAGDIEGAQTLEEQLQQIASEREDAIIRIQPFIADGMSYASLEADEDAYRQAKRKLLEIVSSL